MNKYNCCSSDVCTCSGYKRTCKRHDNYMKEGNITQTSDTKDVLLSFNTVLFHALVGG